MSTGAPTPPYGFAAGDPAVADAAVGDPAAGGSAPDGPALDGPEPGGPEHDTVAFDDDSVAGAVDGSAGRGGAGEGSDDVVPPAAEASGRASGRHRPSALRRLVGVARVLTGGLMVLALVVVAAPLVLTARGPGLDVVLGHLVAALVALAATGFAAWPRTRVPLALAAAIAVPVDVIVVLAVYWWA